MSALSLYWLAPPPFYRYIRVVGTHNTVNRVFHLVCLECLFTNKPFQLDQGLVGGYTTAAAHCQPMICGVSLISRHVLLWLALSLHIAAMRVDSPSGSTLVHSNYYQCTDFSVFWINSKDSVQRMMPLCLLYWKKKHELEGEQEASPLKIFKIERQTEGSRKRTKPPRFDL